MTITRPHNALVLFDLAVDLVSKSNVDRVTIFNRVEKSYQRYRQN